MILKKKTQNLSFFDFYKHEKNQYDSSHEPRERERARERERESRSGAVRLFES